MCTLSPSIRDVDRVLTSSHLQEKEERNLVTNDNHLQKCRSLDMCTSDSSPKELWYNICDLVKPVRPLPKLVVAFSVCLLFNHVSIMESRLVTKKILHLFSHHKFSIQWDFILHINRSNLTKTTKYDDYHRRYKVFSLTKKWLYPSSFVTGLKPVHWSLSKP